MISSSDYSARAEDTYQITESDTLWSEGVIEVDISNEAGNILQIGTQIYTTTWSNSGSSTVTILMFKCYSRTSNNGSNRPIWWWNYVCA